MYKRQVYNKVDYLWQLTGNAAAFYYGVLWNKLYRRDLIQMAHIRFEHVVYACLLYTSRMRASCSSCRMQMRCCAGTPRENGLTCISSSWAL